MPIQCSCVDELEKSVLKKLKDFAEKKIKEIEEVKYGDTDPSTAEAATEYWKAAMEMVDGLIKLPKCEDSGVKP